MNIDEYLKIDIFQNFLSDMLNKIGISATPTVLKILMLIIAFSLVYISATVTKTVAKVILIILAILLGIVLVVGG